MEVFKILKFRLPTSLFELFHISSRKEMTLITPFPSSDFIYRASIIWNTISSKLKLQDYSHNVSLAKSTLKRALIAIQHSDNELDWTENDFDMKRVSTCSKN